LGNNLATTFDSGIQDRFTGLTTNTVTLTHDISAETDILVVWNNIVQDSGTYSVGGTGNKTLTLGGTLVSADIVTVYYTNKVMQSVNPTANSVGITELNLSDGSNGQAITTNGSGTLSFSDTGLTGVTTGSGNVTISNGNLILGTSGKGIDFSATSGTGTSEILADYEEGTFTPTWASNVTISVASGNYGHYRKIGKQVTVYFGAVLNATSPSYYQITNAPFQSNIASGNAVGSGREYGHTGHLHHTTIADNSTTVTMRKYDASAVNNAYLHGQITYPTD
jgi:hypothetical protein